MNRPKWDFTLYQFIIVDSETCRVIGLINLRKGLPREHATDTTLLYGLHQTKLPSSSYSSTQLSSAQVGFYSYSFSLRFQTKATIRYTQTPHHPKETGNQKMD